MGEPTRCAPLLEHAQAIDIYRNEKRAVIGPLLGKEYDLPSDDNVVSPTQQLAQAKGEALAKSEGQRVASSRTCLKTSATVSTN